MHDFKACLTVKKENAKLRVERDAAMKAMNDYHSRCHKAENEIEKHQKFISYARHRFYELWKWSGIGDFKIYANKSLERMNIMGLIDCDFECMDKRIQQLRTELEDSKALKKLKGGSDDIQTET